MWLDLLKPTDAERALAEQATGMEVPATADLAEIESSSRLSTENGVLYLSTPMTYRALDGLSLSAPLGIVLSREHMMTVRFADLPVFDQFADRFNAQGGRGANAAPGSVSAFVGLLEAIVDRLADVLEHIDFTRKVGASKIPDIKLRQLITHFGKYRLRNEDFEFPDLLGAAYEYLIGEFADSAGKKGGEFYTPRSVVRMMVQLLKPQQHHAIYDPCVGSGGMLILSKEYIDEHGGDGREFHRSAYAAA